MKPSSMSENRVTLKTADDSNVSPCLLSAMQQREIFAKKVGQLKNQVRYMAKALALAEARLEAADQMIAAIRDK